MEKGYNWATLLLLCLFFAACQKENLEFNLQNSNSFNDEIVFAEEKSSINWQNRVSINSNLRGISLGNNQHYNALGLSWGAHEGGFDYNLGLKAPVINLRSLEEDPELNGMIHVTSIGKQNSYKRLVNLNETKENTNTKIIKKEFGFNLGLLGIPILSFGGDNKKHFKDYHKRLDDNYMAVLELSSLGSDVRLLLEESSRARLLESHLSQAFQLGKYTMTVGNLSKLYAPFTVVGYRSGAKLLGFFMAEKKEMVDSLSIDKVLNLNVKFLIGSKEKNSDGKEKNSDGKENEASGANNNSGNNGSFVDYGATKGVSSIYYLEKKQAVSRIVTIGGNPTYSIDLPAQDAKDNGVDFSKWLSTASDPKHHKILELLEEGLVPTSFFIPEENLRRRFMDIHKGILPLEVEEVKPKLTIARVFVRTTNEGEDLSDIVCMLRTRNGDQIMLNKVNYDATDDELRSLGSEQAFKRRGKELVGQFRPFFQGLRVSGSPSKVYRPYLRTTLMIEFPFSFDTSTLYRYFNEKNNMWYIYDIKKKLAFAYYDLNKKIPGTTGLDELYGCKPWFSDVEEREISMYELVKYYKIIGL